jgi:hypothetical protein
MSINNKYKSLTLQTKNVKIPKNVLDNMKNCGAFVEKLKGESLYSVSHIVYGDEAWKVYEDWVKTVDGYHKIGAIFLSR